MRCAVARASRRHSAFARAAASVGAAARALLHRVAWLNNWVLLTLVFMLLVVPYGLIARWRRRLRYVTGFEREKPSYRIQRTAEEKAIHLERPF
jgi:hypothetical protein